MFNVGGNATLRKVIALPVDELKGMAKYTTPPQLYSLFSLSTTTTKIGFL